ncbi:unnamed protein product [Amaranthus hypochondriacus]
MAAGKKSFAVMFSVVMILNLIGIIYCGNSNLDHEFSEVHLTQQVSNYHCIAIPAGNCNVRICTELCTSKLKPRCNFDSLCCCS